MQLRSDFKDAFLEKHGVKLGFMSGFVKVRAWALSVFRPPLRSPACLLREDFRGTCGEASFVHMFMSRSVGSTCFYP